MIAVLRPLHTGEWGLRDYGIEQIFGGDKNCEHEWGIQKGSRNIGRDDGIYGGIQKTRTMGATTGGRKKHPIDTNFCLKCDAWKGQLGLEPTPEFYIEHLTEIFNEMKRVLKKTGTLWLNIGDTYTSTAQGTYNAPGQLGAGSKLGQRTANHLANYRPFTGLKSKCMVMIPERLAWSLIQNGWILRNKIPWIKPNCMPSSAQDRFTNKWEYIFYFVKSRKNFFDMQASLEPYTKPLDRWGGDKLIDKDRSTWKKGTGRELYRDREMRPDPAGKHPTDVWIIPTVPCPVKGVHFATFPEELCKKVIIAGCPERGILLDPFCGIGTACLVAKKLGRRYVGIDLKQEYADVARKRLEGFLF